MKKLSIVLMCLLLMCTAAVADSFDPIEFARSCLTEVYGYTEEETSNFVYEDNGAGTLTFYEAGHPGWAYILTYNANGQTGYQTPFLTTYEAYPGESSVRATLQEAKKNNWFTEWTSAHREALRAWMESDLYNIHIRRSFENLLGMDQAELSQIISQFFACCYGSEEEWPAALVEWRDAVLAQYGVASDNLGEPQTDGIKRYTLANGLYMQETELCEFKGEVPEELADIFAAESNLSGWHCLCGTVMNCVSVISDNVDHIGLAAFEKEGRRILVLMDRKDEQWYLWNLGTKALYQDQSMELSILSDPANSTGFLIRYDDEDGVRLFHVSINDPTEDLRGHYALCEINSYQYMTADGQETLWVKLEWDTGIWTYTDRRNGTIDKEALEVDYSRWLGVCDLTDFPDTLEKAKAVPSALPDGYTMASGVHFRKDHSSHSGDQGELQSCVIIPIISTVPGDPFEWIQTTIGNLKGYVSSNYTVYGSDTIHVNTAYPLAIAECKADASLKSATGWLGETVSALPSGTKMHIIMDLGDWMYVVVPQGEISWLMDINGTYGYIHKNDVRIAAMTSYFDWE